MKPRTKAKPYDWIRNVRNLNPITGWPEPTKLSQKSGIKALYHDRRHLGVSVAK